MALFSHLLLRARTPRNDHLRIALLVSVGVHAAVLAIQLHPPQPPLTTSRNLSVALVNTQTELAPLTPQQLAQSNLLGGGNQQEGHSSSPLPRTSMQPSNDIVLADLRKRQEQLEQQQQLLLAQLQTAQPVTESRTQQEHFEDAATPGTDTRDQESIILSAQVAALKERIERYNAQPRQQFVGPSTRADVYAHYLEAWRTKIEQLGTEHYPEQARGRLYGSLQLTVYIRSDGSLAHVEIDRPSEYAVLNMAAQRIVQLAAPFAPLPPAIAKNTDILAITRTWHFQNQQLHTQLP